MCIAELIQMNYYRLKDVQAKTASQIRNRKGESIPPAYLRQFTSTLAITTITRTK